MRRFLTAFAICAALIVPARAGEPGKARENQKAKEAPKVKVSVSTATVKKDIPVPGGAPSPGTFVIGELMKWDQKLLSLHARFTQEFDFSEAGLKQHIEGTLDYKKPGLLKIEHIKPARQLLYTDKKDLWVYKPEDSQVIKTSWAAWKKTQNDNLSGIMEFGDYASLAEKNDVTVSAGANAPYIAVTFTPKGRPQAYKLTLILSTTDYFPTEAALSLEKTFITTKFESAEKNIPLDDAMFRFIPPKGTETLEFKN